MKIRNLLRQILLFGFIIAVTGAALHFLGTMEARLGPLDLVFKIQWASRGETHIILPPMGEVIAQTHPLPVNLSIQLNRLDPAVLNTNFSNYDRPAKYFYDLLPGFRHLITLFILRLMAIGTGAALLAGLGIWGWRDWRRWAISALLGFVLTGAVLLGIGTHYNREAFKTPRYEGMLETAPWLLDLLDNGLSQIDSLSRRLEAVAGNLNRMFNQVDQLAPLAKADGEIKVIHVSDIHNNPAAYEFLARVVKGFGADLILDTGDITDFGTPLEARLAERLTKLGIPYVFVPGNHDSPEVVAHLRRISGLTVLDGRVKRFKGLTIFGLADPASRYGDLMAPQEELETSARQLADLWRNLPSAPDIVAVHNRKTAKYLLGEVPVLLHGHDHQAKIYQSGKSWVIDAGSTGAAGMRGLEDNSKDGVPFSLALLRYDSAPEGSGKAYQLTAVDLIKVYGMNGRFVLERKVLKGGAENAVVSGDLANLRTPGGRHKTHQPSTLR